MRFDFSLVVACISGLAAAQDLRTIIAKYEDVASELLPTSAPWGTDNAADAASNRRDEPTACIDQVGNGPHVLPDTDTAFLGYPLFSAAGLAAAIISPSHFHVVSHWINLKGSNGDNTGYLTFVSSELTSYNSYQCANICDEMTDCLSYVIYFERDPELVWPTTLAPEYPDCPGYANSSSVTLIKCAFYSVPLYSGNATNVDSYEDDFHLVVAGSTAFNRDAPPVKGWTGPVFLKDTTISVPVPVAVHGYIGAQVFPNAAFDPNTCAEICASTEQCTMFNAYVLYENGVNGYV